MSVIQLWLNFSRGSHAVTLDTEKTKPKMMPQNPKNRDEKWLFCPILMSKRKVRLFLAWAIFLSAWGEMRVVDGYFLIHQGCALSDSPFPHFYRELIPQGEYNYMGEHSETTGHLKYGNGTQAENYPCLHRNDGVKFVLRHWSQKGIEIHLWSRHLGNDSRHSRKETNLSQLDIRRCLRLSALSFQYAEYPLFILVSQTLKAYWRQYRAIVSAATPLTFSHMLNFSQSSLI